MSDPPKKTPLPPSDGPPRLERVAPGYQPPPLRAAVGPAAAPPPARPGAAPGVSRGLAAREVTADVAVAAGLPAEGILARDSALRLLYLAAAIQGSGRLTLAGRHEIGLVFKKGAVVHAASTDAADDLLRFLGSKGVLSPTQLEQAEAARSASEGDLVSALVALRLVNPADVAALLSGHGAEIVARAVALEEGSWRWDPAAAPPASSFPLGPPFGMICAAVRALDLEAVRRRLGDRALRSASRVGGRIRVEDLRLTPQETRVAGLFDGVRSPEEIARGQAAAEAAIVLRLALLLSEAELLAFGAPRPIPSTPPSATRPTASAPPPAAQAPSSAPPALPRTAAAPRPAAAPMPRAAGPGPAAPKPPGAPALDLAALQATLARLQGADHFAALGVKPDATAAQIKMAYFQLAKSYHPDAVPAGAPPEVSKACGDVFARISEAWGVLGDDARRARYVEDLRTGGGKEVDVMAILQAENAFQMATVLVKARKYDDALSKLGEAMKLNPDEAEFGMWRAWCEFLLAPEKKKRHAQASAEIEAALKKNPRCAQGYLFLGQMAKIVGDLSLAEKHLKRGLSVAPEHAELARELKYLRK